MAVGLAVSLPSSDQFYEDSAPVSFQAQLNQDRPTEGKRQGSLLPLALKLHIDASGDGRLVASIASPPSPLCLVSSLHSHSCCLAQAWASLCFKCFPFHVSSGPHQHPRSQTHLVFSQTGSSLASIMTTAIHNHTQTNVSPTYETIQINARHVSPQQLLHVLAQRLPTDKFSVEMQQDVYTIRWDRDYLGSGRQQEATSTSH
ncbi:hypothetical protein B0T10DRAFT_579489 [Thelonectria olida]|uniref:Uncharacterized protein n=1 Tax=Thelonectria olida TaxID=1576542 RepID=A0A9P8W0H9_9HYPO|nr:hypothetical protein B0T10DRAFT_579489 [Thelonectria olida]